MKSLLLGLVFLILSVLVGLQLKQDPGYLFIAFRHWTIETPLWFFLLILLLLFFIFALLLRLFHYGKLLNFRWHLWFSKHKTLRQQKKTHLGMMELLEEQWPLAEKNLLRGVETEPLLSYLAAAYAAQQQNALARVNQYLLLAEENTEDTIGVKFFALKLKIQQQAWDEALGILQQLPAQHPLVLKYSVMVYQQLAQWMELKNLFPRLQKSKIFTTEEFNALQVLTYVSLLQQEASDKFMVLWTQIPSALKYLPSLAVVYVAYLIQENKGYLAKQFLLHALAKHWDATLLRLYAQLPMEAAPLLRTAEAWLKTHGSDPVLTLTLGQLALKSHLWGKALQYLQKSLEQKPCPEVYLCLGQWYEHQKQPEQAKQYYFRGLKECKGS